MEGRGPPLKRWFVNTALVLLSLAVGFVAINASFTLIFRQSIFPRALVASAGHLQYTLYPDTFDRAHLDSWVAVVGDSYGQGAGDSYLDGDADYSIFHHLRKRTGASYLIFARSGFGSIKAARQLVRDVELMNDSLVLPDLDRPDEILVLFYEGNDLNNNLMDLEGVGESAEAIRAFVRNALSKAPSWSDRIDSQLPFGRVLYDLARDPVGALTGSNEPGPPPGATRRFVDLHGEEVVVGPLQGAALELSTSEIERALAVFVETLEWLREWSPESTIRVVYIPSVVTAYDWPEPVPIQTYHSDGPLFARSEDNLRQSRLIRERLERAVTCRGFGFIDATETIRARARTRLVHGPRDWKHLNARGYEVVAEAIAGESGLTGPSGCEIVSGTG